MEDYDVTTIDSFPGQYPEALFFLNPQGEFTFLNEPFGRLTGYTAATLTGKPLTQLLAPGGRKATEPLLEQALRGKVLTLNLQLLDPTGQPRELVVTTFPLFRQTELMGMGGVVQATEDTDVVKKEAEEREKHLSVIFHSIADIIFVLEPAPDQRWRFLFANRAFGQTTGLPIEKVVGHYVQDIIPEPSLSLALAKYQHAAQTKQRVVWIETTDYPTGQLIGQVSVTPVLDGEGACCQLVGIVHDLTEQKRVEEELRVSNERFNYAIKATSDAIYDWDVQANTLFWGEGFEVLYGHRIIHNPTPFSLWANSVHPDDKVRVVDNLLELVKQSSPTHWQREYRFQRANGSWAIVFDRGHIIRNEAGLATRMIGAMQDITQRKEDDEKQQQMAQELFQQNADLQQFTYIVSHNLRAPLANARGYVDLLTRVAKDSDVFEVSMQNLKTSMEQLETVISDVNDILTIREKTELSNTASVNMAAVCEQVCQSLSQALLDCGGTITCNIPADLRVAGNRAYLHSIFFNLLANAIKYRSERRPLRVEVTGKGLPTEPGKPGIVVTVADNGSGFDLEKAGDDVFQLYKRFHTIPPGRGMGLFLVKSHVEAMGGHVEVRSRPEEGTTFTLYLS